MHLRVITVSLVPAMLALAQYEAPTPSFVAELREEVWFDDGTKDEHTITVTRVRGRGILIMRPTHDRKNRHIREHSFYMTDKANRSEYTGDTRTGAAFRASLTPTDGSTLREYSDCSPLTDPDAHPVEAGEALGYPVVRTERTEGDELYTTWIAEELGCFPLIRQVLVDGLVRQRIAATTIRLLPEPAQLSLPEGIRVVSPETFCKLYKQAHGEEFLSPELCARLQMNYGQE